MVAREKNARPGNQLRNTPEYSEQVPTSDVTLLHARRGSVSALITSISKSSLSWSLRAVCSFKYEIVCSSGN